MKGCRGTEVDTKRQRGGIQGHAEGVEGCRKGHGGAQRVAWRGARGAERYGERHKRALVVTSNYILNG